MPRLTTLKPRVATISTARAATPHEVNRQRGRTLMRLRARLLRANPLCVMCKREGRIAAAEELDHVVPLHRGGSNDESNLQGLCKRCHLAKSNAERNAKPKGGDVNGMPTDPRHHWHAG